MEMPTNEPTWMVNQPVKDCTLGLCSMFCPQWCYIIFSPPPSLEFSDDSSSPSLSPLVVAVIGIVASAFLLVCYYTLASKYCRTFNSLRGRQQNSSGPGNQQRNRIENWAARTTQSGGLDETLINKITVCKYGKGSGFVDANDCSVCLSEFENDEVLRLLPKCRHAFHVQCIDTWLKSHSNCPLCRALITPLNFATTMPVTESSSPVDQQAVRNDEVSVPSEETEISNTVQRMQSSADIVVEIRNDVHGDIEPVRPSFSLDSSSCSRGFDRR